MTVCCGRTKASIGWHNLRFPSIECHKAWYIWNIQITLILSIALPVDFPAGIIGCLRILRPLVADGVSAKQQHIGNVNQSNLACLCYRLMHDLLDAALDTAATQRAFHPLAYCRTINFHCPAIPCRNAIRPGEKSAEADTPPVTAVQ